MSSVPGVRIEPVQIQNYADFKQDNEYTNVGGVVVMPVAARASAFKLIRLHGGYGLRKTKWHAARANQPPMIPAAVNTKNDVILASVVHVPLPSPNPNGAGYDWTVTGEYSYVQAPMRTPGYNALPSGNYPFPVVPQAAMAAGIVSDDTFVNKYVGPQPLDSLIDYVAGIVPIVEGSFAWPFTALPSIMSSTHLIEG